MLGLHLGASRVTARQLPTSRPISRLTILRAFATSSLVYSSFKRPRPPDPWKEWVKPNKRSQARQEIYGSCWPDTQSHKEISFANHLGNRRERAKAKLRRRLGDKYDAFAEERSKEVFEHYASAAWREEIEHIKEFVLAMDERRRWDGFLRIDVPRTEFSVEESPDNESRPSESRTTESQGDWSQELESQDPRFDNTGSRG